MFTTSLRFNIDPRNEYADSDIWLALEACRLKEVVGRMPNGLDSAVETEDALRWMGRTMGDTEETVMGRDNY